MFRSPADLSTLAAAVWQRGLLRLLPVLTVGCEVAPLEYDYGDDLKDLELSLYSETVGVYPSTDILADPYNPFAPQGIEGEVRWDLIADGRYVPGFYAWATWLTQEPSGEAQFYTAQSLHQIYLLELAASEDLYFVRELALDGYAAQLTHFPDAVTYDATGTVAYAVAPLSYGAILALGGEVPEGWTSITTESGELVVFYTGVP